MHEQGNKIYKEILDHVLHIFGPCAAVCYSDGKWMG